MKRMLLLIILAIAAACTVALAAVATASPPDELQALRAAAARYHSLEQAERAGYTVEGEPCVESPLGAMGVHAVNPALLADPAIDPLRPEILLYLPNEEGKLKQSRTMQTFLVEHYRPGVNVESLRRAAALVLRATQAMESEGRCVRCLRTTIVPADEGFLLVIEASSEDAVRDAFGRAGVPFERISIALDGT